MIEPLWKERFRTYHHIFTGTFCVEIGQCIYQQTPADEISHTFGIIDARRAGPEFARRASMIPKE